MSLAKRGLVVFISAVASWAPLARADLRTFQKIVDTNTPIPGGTGNFSNLIPAQVHQGNVVFAGSGSGSGAATQRGIYRFNPATSALSTVVDQNTTLPGATTSQLTTNLQDGSFAIFGPDVAFNGNAPFDQRILSTRGGLHVVTGANPQSQFGYNAPLSMSDQYYAGATDLPRSGSGFLLVKSFAKISEAGLITNGPSQEDVFKYLVRGSFVAHTTRGRIAGTPGQHILNSSAGIFRFTGVIGEPPEFLIPGETSGPTLPGSTTGTIFSDDGSSVVFRAATATRTTLLTKPSGGDLRVVVDTNTLIPTFDGTSTFASFTDVAIDSGVIAFIGAPATGPAGIFAESGPGSLTEIVSAGDTLDGKTIASLGFSGDRPLSAQNLAFTATFSDGSTGLFLATVPEPSTLGLLLAAAIPLALRRRP